MHRSGVISRPRLIKRLDRGAASKLTLVSAPAGFGKTTLVAEWLAEARADERSVAWLSLDPGDNQPATFWPYLIAALDTVLPGIGVDALALLHESQPPPIETVLATLINELAAAPDDVVLVLDDDHLVDTHDIQTGMWFLIDHLPAQIHIVILTRADPALPLARLRGRGELVEIRAADLRFTPDESAVYLNDAMGLGLTATDVASLEKRTEGWISALQLAALSIPGHPDAGAFIASFAGDDRYIVDYLVEEVLQQQSEQVRRFLLETSILDQLTGSLCDAVTGQVGGKATLEALDRANLFIVPLDDRRHAYRYHRLFADVLQAHLVDELPDDVALLHRRASDWYEQNGDRIQAVVHAVAAKDFERAADLTELALPELSRTRQEQTMRRLLDAIPDDLFQARPVLAVGYVGSRMVSGDLEGVEARLRQAERWLEKAPLGRQAPESRPRGMVVVDEETFRRLPALVALYRTALARAAGDVDATITHALRVSELAAESDYLERGGAAGFLGLSYWTRGDLTAAAASWAVAATNLLAAGHVSDAIGCSIAIGDIRIAQGSLSEAVRTYDRGLELAAESRAQTLRGVPDMHVGMSEVLFERNDLELAARQLSLAEDLGERAGLAQNAYRSRIVKARLFEAHGDLDAALKLLDDAERLYAGDYYPNVRPVAALRAQMLIAHGRPTEALNWARDRGLTVADDLSYLREFEHVTFARMLLAGSGRETSHSEASGAVQLLERLLLAAAEGSRTGSVIRILVLLAVTHDVHGDSAKAIARLNRALVLAEPEGYVRIFVDEGPHMASLLKVAVDQGMASRYVQRLLNACAATAGARPAKQALTEPLSDRELDVLRLLATDLTGPEVASQLFVSLHTVRSHTKSIYAKLGVNGRRAAVSRAYELGILAGPGRN